MLNRKSSAIWYGGLKEGKGTLNVERAGFEAPYSFPSRFEEGTGLSPEDLIAAAHAGCFSMAFSAALEKNGFVPDRVETTARVTLEFVNGAPTVTKIHLDSRGRVPNISDDDFQKYADDAKQNCPISRLLKAAEITLDAKLER